jgi:ACS family hexuronate transporter-like MFS transporter
VWTVAHVGWRGAFLMTGFIGAAWLLIWFLTYSKPENSRFTLPVERQYILEDRPDPHTAARPQTPWASLLRQREVRGLVASRFLFDPVFYFYMFWIPQYLSQARGASLERIGQLTWIPFLTLGISSVFGGWVSDRLVRAGVPVAKARKQILLASALLTPVSILAVFVYRTETAIALMSVLMFAHGFWITNYMTIIGDLFPRTVVATVIGLTGTAGGIGGFLTSLLIGKVVQSVSYTPVFIAAGVMYPICVLILFGAIRRPFAEQTAADSSAHALENP